MSSGGSSSVMLDQAVRARVSLAGRLGGRRRVTAELSGTVVPAHTGESIMIQMDRSGTWRTVLVARLHAGPRGHGDSTFAAVAHLAGSHSRFRFRAILGADPRNVRSLSPTLALPASL